MLSGIPGKAFEELVTRLEELDDTHPFDNGMNYRDVSDVRTYPSRKSELEEADTPPGKKHPMPPPEVYMKEMYRNCCRRWREEKNGD